MNTARRIEAIDALLPQTQCGKCGHPGCLPYATGIANGEAINKCPPGGQKTLHALAELLQVAPLPLEQPEVAAQVALIHEDQCIGCTKCIQVCPVDAIVGAAKLMHSVISDECSGCELCLAPCPVDCIELLVLPPAQAHTQHERASHFRSRHQARSLRLARDNARRHAAAPTNADARTPSVAAITGTVTGESQAAQIKRLRLEAAMARIAYEQCRQPTLSPPDAVFAARLGALHGASERAECALQAALSQTQGTSDTPMPTGERLLKQAKIELANCRAALRAAERRKLDEDRLAPLRSAYADAQIALQAAEAQCGKPLPQRTLVDKAGLSPELRQLKTDLAYARADLNKLQRGENTDGTLLQAAQQRLMTAERRLQEHGATPQSP
jgi:electron transport complex protein RnfB